jgi:hypothetical protein
MSYSIKVLTIIMLAGVFVLSGCDQPSNRMERDETSVIEANRDMENAISDMHAELSTYRVETENRIVGYNQTMEEIKQKIVNETDLEVRQTLERKLSEIEDTRRELKLDIDNYRVSDRENWVDFKDSFSNRMDELGNSLENFFTTSGSTTTTTN